MNMSALARQKRKLMRGYDQIKENRSLSPWGWMVPIFKMRRFSCLLRLSLPIAFCVLLMRRIPRSESMWCLGCWFSRVFVLWHLTVTMKVSIDLTEWFQSYTWFLNNSLYNVTCAVCYLHIKQIAISRERRAIWKNYRWSSFIISRVLSNKTNLIFISCALWVFYLFSYFKHFDLLFLRVSATVHEFC